MTLTLDLVYICHGRRAITSCAIFRTVFWDIFCDYGLRRMCLHNTRLSCDFYADSRGLIETNPCGGCAEIVRQSCNFSAVTAQSLQAFCGIVRSPCGFRAEAVRRSGNGDDGKDSRINSCIRVSKCPRVTRLSSHGFTQTVLSLRLSLLFAALPERPGLQCTPAPFYSPASTVI